MMSHYFRTLPRFAKQGIAVVCDVLLAWFALLMAFALHFDQLVWPTESQWWTYALAPLLAIPIFMWLGLYRAVIRYTGLRALEAVAKAVGLYGLLFLLLVFMLHPEGVPRAIGVLQPLLMLVGVATSRALVRFWLNDEARVRKNTGAERLIIYGAGAAGIQIAHALSHAKPYHIVGFIDDAISLQGKTINGWRVYAPHELAALIAKGKVQSALLAIPSLARPRRLAILEDLRASHIHVRSLPSVEDLASGQISIADVHELEAEDLLGRTPIAPDLSMMARTITGKVVMVTGAGGSIGGELCRQILLLKPRQLLLLDHHEFGVYSIHRELAVKCPIETTLIPLLASVREADRMMHLFATFRPQTVYHAAAYKHVPLVEQNIAQGLSTNVWGTWNTARAAKQYQTECFVLISTDKAVRPTNVMGATKRMAELVLQALAEDSKREASSDVGSPSTHFTMVRFGNVLDSSGSVVPLFRQQIKQGGPVTLTDARVTRYFMTIPEAAQLVIQAAAMAQGGEVFVLDMGEPVLIADLAKRMIELSGYRVQDAHNPQGDIAIEITGLRPGEKLYEELLIGDNPEPSAHPKIMKANEKMIASTTLEMHLTKLQQHMAVNDIHAIKDLLLTVVDGYSPDTVNVDWLNHYK